MIDASLTTFASVIATPAATAAEPPVAEPSAFEAAAAVSDDVTVSAPPAVTEPTVACADALAIVTATAAATDTGPPEVDADGVELPPEPEPPLPDERLPALLRSPATWPSTPPAGAELDVPFADAVAEPLVEEVPVAVNDAAPPTVSERLLVAETSWVASATATDAPTAAVDADAEPEADVVTDAVWVAATVRFPATEVGPPVPSDAVVVTVESDTATDGATETPPPAAPPTEVAATVSVLVACTVRSWALAVAPFASVASVVSVARVSATEAPSPKLVPPLEAAFAVEVDCTLDAALTVSVPAPAAADPVAPSSRGRRDVPDRQGQRAGRAHGAAAGARGGLGVERVLGARAVHRGGDRDAVAADRAVHDRLVRDVGEVDRDGCADRGRAGVRRGRVGLRGRARHRGGGDRGEAARA